MKSVNGPLVVWPDVGYGQPFAVTNFKGHLLQRNSFRHGSIQVPVGIPLSLLLSNFFRSVGDTRWKTRLDTVKLLGFRISSRNSGPESVMLVGQTSGTRLSDPSGGPSSRRTATVGSGGVTMTNSAAKWSQVCRSGWLIDRQRSLTWTNTLLILSGTMKPMSSGKKKGGSANQWQAHHACRKLH